MPETFAPAPNSKSAPPSAADKAALAQVEKWIAVIRDLARGPAKS